MSNQPVTSRRSPLRRQDVAARVASDVDDEAGARHLREDLRHLLKHKRSYCPERLTARERRILARPAMVSRLWMAMGKPVYLFVTRRLFGWADREGAGDRRF